ncbi:carbohydrate ABC transporter substrate-binding protein, CUT1 family [Austwickia chelonae]|uniref:Putative ABC transporter substrate-binding protein n=1 Tax=Austwickia chelonae NBRC 105200 TaxID=1184607 RepID=K6UMI1_9MICO|nr:extracellular solute-binding protein [Austwickia chelonae]GAB78136.1 putative ABC transporter substrate-binding protein [Austwickia chelonae NBRC 105200]SEV97360.1 carbohydrate ABC transporter substrate-binding protein, CUT1 family [Austwickia chelonae]
MRRSHKFGQTIAVVTAAVLAGAGATGCSNPPSAHEVVWYINPDRGNTDPTRGGQAQLAKECSQTSGGEYSIKVVMLPNSASDQRQQLLRRLVANDASMDIMSVDPAFVSELAEPGYLVRVPENLRAQFTDGVVTAAVDSSTWKNELVGAPLWANTQLLWYRKSVARAAGLDLTQPVTWDQVIDAAAAQHRTVGVQSKPYEGYTVWVNSLIEGAGGKIIEKHPADPKNMEFGLAGEAGRKAAQIIKKLDERNVGGPAMGANDEPVSLDLFSDDKNGGFLVNWPYVWSALQEKNPKAAEDLGWARYPRTVPDKESRPPLGGIVLGVNRASTKQQKAWKAISCLTDTPRQKLYMSGSGNPAARRAVYTDPEILQKFPMAPMIRESLDAAAPRPKSQYYGDISTAIYQMYSPPHAIDPDAIGSETAHKIKAVIQGKALL